ncbi:unnamed protein product [Laminaria digitata]
MDDFMTGDLSYAVAVPDTPDASLTVQPGARARASAWQDVDPRVRRGLPLVAPPRSRDAVPLVETGARVVTVRLRYVGEGLRAKGGSATGEGSE